MIKTTKGGVAFWLLGGASVHFQYASADHAAFWCSSRAGEGHLLNWDRRPVSYRQSGSALSNGVAYCRTMTWYRAQSGQEAVLT